MKTNPFQPERGKRGKLRNGEVAVYWTTYDFPPYYYGGYTLLDGVRCPQLWRKDGLWREDGEHCGMDLML